MIPNHLDSNPRRCLASWLFLARPAHLTKRKLIPALAISPQDNLLPEQFAIVWLCHQRPHHGELSQDAGEEIPKYARHRST